MIEKDREMRLGAVLWSALLIWILPIVYRTIVTLGYGFTVGFQTRGDQEIIEERVLAFVTSPAFEWSVYVVAGLVILWRSYVLVQSVGANEGLHVAGAVVGGVILTYGMLLLFPVEGDGSVISSTIIFELLIYAAAAIGGVYIGRESSPAPAG